jgi:hypothetical protein
MLSRARSSGNRKVGRGQGADAATGAQISERNKRFASTPRPVRVCAERGQVGFVGNDFAQDVPCFLSLTWCAIGILRAAEFDGTDASNQRRALPSSCRLGQGHQRARNHDGDSGSTPSSRGAPASQEPKQAVAQVARMS